MNSGALMNLLQFEEYLTTKFKIINELLFGIGLSFLSVQMQVIVLPDLIGKQHSKLSPLDPWSFRPVLNSFELVVFQHFLPVGFELLHFEDWEGDDQLEREVAYFLHWQE
jgi:hypothetical protein